MQRINSNRILFPKVNGRQDSLKMIDNETHSFLSLSSFTNSMNKQSINSNKVAALVSHSASSNLQLERPISELSRIVKRVHQHVCGHATYGDMKTLLIRNSIWNDEVQRLLADTVEKCENCIAASPPPTNRPVSITGINRQFNDLVCIDHFYLDV